MCVARLPEHRRHVYPAVECDVRPRTRPSLTESKHASRAARRRDSERRRDPIDAGLQIGTGHRHASLLLDPQLGSGKRDLERRGIARVADEQVRDAMRHEIERTTDGHTARLMSPSSLILNRREESRSNDGDRSRAGFDAVSPRLPRFCLPGLSGCSLTGRHRARSARCLRLRRAPQEYDRDQEREADSGR